MPNRRILIADDEPDIADVVSAIAEDLGFEVTYVQEGNQVTSRAEAMDPSVIVLDLRMPGTDGVQILRELAEHGCTASIILMSGMDQRTINSVESLGKEKHLNIVSTLSKPMHPDDIEAALSPLIQHVTTEQLTSQMTKPAHKSTFGPRVYFIPQKPIREEGSALHRAALEAAWIFDDSSSISGEKLFEWAIENKISKSILALILREALQQWKALGNQSEQLQLVLPLNPTILEDPDVFNLIAETARDFQFPEKNLIVETSEVGIHQSSGIAVESLSRLRIAGFQTAFITESNADELLTLIDKLPLDEIVVDMSFLANNRSLGSNMELEFTYSSLTSLAHKKQIDTSARGVSNDDIADFVSRCQFHWAEGSGIANKVPISDLADFYR